MPHLPDVGDLFGRYRIEALIGSGGMGAVYLAEDPRLGRKVALKLVSRAGDPASADEFVRRFEREAGVLARLDSRRVIAVYDYGEEDGQPFIVTQYVAGGDLGHLLREYGPLRPALAAAICAQVADALADAHTAGVVHRDVKPANVLVRDPAAAQPEVLLCDFGVARTHSDGLTTPGSVTGTWAYLAPECGRGEPATPASDLYALGCVLWTCLTGAPPYDGSDVEIAIAHQQQPVPQLAATTPGAAELNPVLARMLAKAPQDRYADATACRRDLEHLAATLMAIPALGTDATTYSSDATVARAEAPRPRRRRRVLIAGLAALVVLLGTGTALAVTRPWEGAAAAEPITGDLDGDGHGDLKAVLYRYQPATAQPVTWLWNGTTFAARKPAEKPVASALAFPHRQWFWGDFDGDGKQERSDWTLTGQQWHVTATLSGGGTIDTTVPAQSVPAGSLGTAVISIADLNGDGKDDLLSVAPEPNDVHTLRFEGSLRTASGWSAPKLLLDFTDTVHGWQKWITGDFDGDGIDDLALTLQPIKTDKQGKAPLTLTLFRGTGTGFTKWKTATYDELNVSSLIAADLDGDGTDELVTSSFGADGEPGQLRVIRTGAAKLTPGPTVRLYLGEATEHANETVSDVNGDGIDDIVGVNQQDDGTTLFRVAYGDGHGGLRQARQVGSMMLPKTTDWIGLQTPGGG